jgi:hypothetical protein
MKRWMAQLDAACAWVNPGLMAVALILAVLDIAAAGQRSTLAHPQPSVPTKTVIVAARIDAQRDIKSEQCAPAPPPELRDMVGRD